MKIVGILLLAFLIISCGGVQNSGDFRTSSEILKEEKRGSVFGKDRLGWKWQQNETEKSAASQQDGMWAAANIVLSRYPISFSNFPARVIQTGWIHDPNKPHQRYRITVRLLGKLPEKENLEVLVFFEQLKNNVWESIVSGNNTVRTDITSKILDEALRIFDQQKQD